MFPDVEQVEQRRTFAFLGTLVERQSAHRRDALMDDADLAQQRQLQIPP